MSRQCLAVAMMAGVLFAPGTVWPYDQGLAESYARLFEPASGAQTGKALHLMKPDILIEKVRTGERMTLLDIRTPAEMSIFTAALPGSLAIPINRLFLPDNLARLPTDMPIVVLCKSGIRSAAAGTALRHIGFDNTFVLQGGFKALIDYLDAKTANTPAAGGSK